MSIPKLTLVSHKLCPYVQRAAIVLEEKGADYTRINIDLSNKPDWFLQVSPLGKTPVLLVDNRAIFESSVICEYFEETLQPALHPASPLERAQHRAWMEFGSAVLAGIAAYYTAPTEEKLLQHARALHDRFATLETLLAAGPFFAGERFSIVDAVFAPVFRYFDVFERFHAFDFFEGLPRVADWRRQLSQRHSVVSAVRPDYPDHLEAFLQARGSALGRLVTVA